MRNDWLVNSMFACIVQPMPDSSATSRIVIYSVLLYTQEMRVVTHSRIVEAQKKHAESATALDYWYRLTKRGMYRNFAELRATFGSVDRVDSLYVFNVGGNKLRLIAAVHFNTRKVFIRHVLTHERYDRGKWMQSEA